VPKNCETELEAVGKTKGDTPPQVKKNVDCLETKHHSKRTAHICDSCLLERENPLEQVFHSNK
jgi:hypothetical protein